MKNIIKYIFKRMLKCKIIFISLYIYHIYTYIYIYNYIYCAIYMHIYYILEYLSIISYTCNMQERHTPLATCCPHLHCPVSFCSFSSSSPWQLRPRRSMAFRSSRPLEFNARPCKSSTLTPGEAPFCSRRSSSSWSTQGFRDFVDWPCYYLTETILAHFFWSELIHTSGHWFVDVRQQKSSSVRDSRLGPRYTRTIRPLDSWTKNSRWLGGTAAMATASRTSRTLSRKKISPGADPEGASGMLGDVGVPPQADVCWWNHVSTMSP